MWHYYWLEDYSHLLYINNKSLSHITFCTVTAVLFIIIIIYQLCFSHVFLVQHEQLKDDKASVSVVQTSVQNVDSSCPLKLINKRKQPLNLRLSYSYISFVSYSASIFTRLFFALWVTMASSHILCHNHVFQLFPNSCRNSNTLSAFTSNGSCSFGSRSRFERSPFLKLGVSARKQVEVVL